jgi:hypothetical protein
VRLEHERIADKVGTVVPVNMNPDNVEKYLCALVVMGDKQLHISIACDGTGCLL